VLGSKKVVQSTHSPDVQDLLCVKELLEAGKETWSEPVQQAGGCCRRNQRRISTDHITRRREEVVPDYERQDKAGYGMVIRHLVTRLQRLKV
jgi:hypothetical protein